MFCYCWLSFLSIHKYIVFPGLNISLKKTSSVLFGIMRKYFKIKWGEENNEATHIMLLVTSMAVRQRKDLPTEGTEGLSLDVLRVWSMQYLRDQHKMEWVGLKKNKKSKPNKSPHLLPQLKDRPSDLELENRI